MAKLQIKVKLQKLEQKMHAFTELKDREPHKT